MKNIVSAVPKQIALKTTVPIVFDHKETQPSFFYVAGSTFGSPVTGSVFSSDIVKFYF